MRKMFLNFSVILFLCVNCFSQIRKPQDSSLLTVCWTGSPDTFQTSYIVYYKYYQNSDTSWKFLGNTKLSQFTLNKGSIKGSIILGVRTINYTDTSDMHASTDTTACVTPGCGPDCVANGGWYVDWHTKKPKNMATSK